MNDIIQHELIHETLGVAQHQIIELIQKYAPVGGGGGGSVDGYVPYIGANQTVNLGAQDLATLGTISADTYDVGSDSSVSMTADAGTITFQSNVVGGNGENFQIQFENDPNWIKFLSTSGANTIILNDFTLFGPLSIDMEESPLQFGAPASAHFIWDDSNLLGANPDKKMGWTATEYHGIDTATLGTGIRFIGKNQDATRRGKVAIDMPLIPLTDATHDIGTLAEPTWLASSVPNTDSPDGTEILRFRNMYLSGNANADKFFINSTRIVNLKGGFAYDSSGFPIIELGLNASQFGDKSTDYMGVLFREDLRANVPIFSIKVQGAVSGEISPLQISKRTGSPVLIGYANDNNTGTGNDEPLQVNGAIAENGTTLASKYLGITAKASDSDKLDNHDSTYFATATHTHTKHFIFTVLDPSNAYAINPKICFVPKLTNAITVTNIEVTCDADPTTEPAGDIKYADTFIGLANPVVINDFDTTNGVRSDSTITSASVASGKAMYIQFDSQPSSAIKSMTFDITYTD